MKRIICLNILILLMVHLGYAQSNKLDRRLEKANDLMNQNKLEDAEKYMLKILDEEKDFGKGWDYLVSIRYKQYKESLLTDGIFSNMKVTTKDKDGKETQSTDSMTNALTTLLAGIKPSKMAYSKFMYTLRKATLYSDDAYNSSMYLRMFLVDPKVDTLVNKKALKYFNDAETEFQEKNYEKAARLYKRAISEQPDFYKARLYMGDAFYFSGDYVEASKSFSDAVKSFPNLLEPRKYLLDAYAKSGLYEKAVQEGIYSMAVYPDLSMKAKLDDAIYFTNRRLDIKWTSREIFPNKIIFDTTNHDLNTYFESIDYKPTGKWILYRNSLDKIKKYCNDKGVIIIPNSLTKSGYLEVFSWEEMLKSNNDPSLEEARKMQLMGYLDCYVFVTCFHQDIYEQYLDFASKNSDKISEYFAKFLVPLK